MNNTGTGFEVTMHLWVEEVATGKMLLGPELCTYVVQPPAWAQDTSVELEMHLDHLTKIKYLHDVARRVRAEDASVAHIGHRDDIIVRGLMVKYLHPSNSRDVRHEVAFPPDKLRAA